ncbi:MAG: outer membrane protein assembly factor BamA [Candidatus Kapabacteria bacterium]|nr:outer membrane protein assembly factor BamA [Candidatus Kapabacteria bacterium]
MLLKNKLTLFLFIFWNFLILLVSTSFSQEKDIIKTYVIAGINVEGNKFAESETIIALSGLTVGDKFNFPYDEKIATSIKNLWERKQFSNVDIVISRVTSLGVFFTIKVEEFQRLSEIKLDGNSQIKDKDVLKAIGKSRGDIINKYHLYLAKKAIKKLYDDEHYVAAKISLSLEKTDSTTHSNLKVVIDEGTEYFVKSIVFDGNSELSSSDLASSFDKTHSKSWYEFWKSSKFDKKEYKKDLERLNLYLKKSGFIDAYIKKDTIAFNSETGAVDVKIDIFEGNRVYIRKIKFSGNTVYNEETLLKRIEFKKGDLYNVERFERNLRGNEEFSDASSLYHNSGYLAAQFEKEETRIGKDSIDLSINIFENDRFKIRRVDIVGNTKTKDKVIRRELFTHPGDYFDRSAIIRSVRTLSSMNYFNPESLQPRPEPVPNDKTSVDIIYKVEERSTDTFNASVGFAGTFGLTGSIGLTFNNFSIDEPLFGGGGQLFNFNWEFGQMSRLQQFSIGYTQPWFNDSPTTIGFNLFDSRINYGYQLRRTGASLNLGRRFRWPDDYFRGDLFLRYQLNDNQSTSNYGYYRPGKNTEATIGFGVSRNSLDHPFFPSSGSKFSLNTNFALGGVGLGQTDYFKNEFLFEFYNPLMKIKESNRLVLMLSTKIGYLTGLSSDTAFSPIELYRMGGNGLSGFGVTPLRGYADQSIESQGGKVMARFIAELRFAISVDPMPIFFYGFAEAGNVWKSLTIADPFSLKRSAGVGLQMLLNPIGIIGFSYGYGFDPTGTDFSATGWKFLFHLGQ